MGMLGPVVGIVYQALWCLADDGGTALCTPEIVKGKLFMFWPSIGLSEISESLERLAVAERIERYSIGDDEYASIRHFRKHQRVHKPSSFRHPRPGQQVTGSKGEGLRHQCGTSTAKESTPRILDTYTPRHLKTYSLEFEEFWKGYPKRSGGNSKDEAFAAWNARLKTGESSERMLAGGRLYKAYCDATGKTGTEFVKQARTFLGKGRHYLDPWTISSGKNGDSEAVKRGWLNGA